MMKEVSHEMGEGQVGERKSKRKRQEQEEKKEQPWRPLQIGKHLDNILSILLQGK